MSAFVVDPDTMNRCVRAICAKGQYGQIIDTFAGLGTSDPKNRTEIGRRLFALNVEAVMQRYDDTQDNPADMPGPIEPIPAAQLPKRYVYRGGAVPPNAREMAGLVKALRCLRYQCSGGDVGETPLFAELANAIGAVCEHIVASMPEYERAAWG